MENWLKYFLLATSLCSLPATLQVHAQTETEEPAIEPRIDRRSIDIAALDTENIEIGAYYGVLSIEDFDSSDVLGVRAAWHLSEDFFVEATAASAEGDLTSFEELSGGSPLFTDKDRDYRYYNIGLGWNVLPGEIFIGNRYAFNSSVYLLAAVGSTRFLGDDWLTFSYGAGLRLLLNDWVAWHIDVRDHVFDRDSLGQDETTHNVEFHTGFTVFF